MNILMCDTQYTFLQYFLLMPFAVFKDTFFCFDSCFSQSIVENLEKAGMACHQKLYDDIPIEERPAAYYSNQNYLETIIKGFYDYFHGDVCIYGQDHIGIAQILWRNKLKDIPFVLLEDGVGNYCKKHPMHKIPAHMNDEGYFFGRNSRVHKVFLTGIWKIPNDVKGKVSVIDIKGSWENKSYEEKKFFLDLYFIDEAILNDIALKKICYLGQSFSNFEIISLEKELSAYRRILSNYNPSDLYIKPHPTGFNINYEKEFPGIYILMNPIPFEVLYFLTGAKLEVVASIESTAAMCVDESVEQHYYDMAGNRIELKYPLNALV